MYTTCEISDTEKIPGNVQVKSENLHDTHF